MKSKENETLKTLEDCKQEISIIQSIIKDIVSLEKSVIIIDSYPIVLDYKFRVSLIKCLKERIKNIKNRWLA